MFSKLFLPVGIIIAGIISVFVPEVGISVKQFNSVQICVILIFLIYGIKFKISELKLSFHLMAVLFVMGTLSLIITPLIVSLSAPFFLNESVVLGLIIISAMPPTLSSGIVMADNSNGNTALAISTTIILNLFSLITITLIVPFLLNVQEDIRISPLSLLLKMVFLILLPFMVGQVMRNVLKKNYSIIFRKISARLLCDSNSMDEYFIFSECDFKYQLV